MQWEEEVPKCPACSAPCAKGAAECGACGAVFAKWKAKAAREAPMSVRESPADAPVPSGHLGGGGIVKLLGAGTMAASLGACAWLFYSGSGAAGGAAPLAETKGAFAFAAPEGWSEKTLDACGGVWNGCTIRTCERPDRSAGGFQPAISLRVVKKGAAAFREDRKALVQGLADEIEALCGEAGSARLEAARVDGVDGFRVECRGRRHFRVEVAPAVEVSAQYALQEQMRQNPNKGVYTVQARLDPRRPGADGFVRLKEAEFAEFDARPVAGRIVVPARDAIAILSYQYDEELERADRPAVDAAAASLRVLSRPRPADELGGLLSTALVTGALFALAAGWRMFSA